MKVQLNIPMDASARMAAHALEGLARAATEEIAGGGVPVLYRAGVRYQRELPGHEEWLLPSQVIAGGVGDCEDLAAYRVGELRASGADEGASIVLVSTGPRTLHAVVRRSDGQIEDPSRVLGMRGGSSSLVPRLVAGVERGHSWMEGAWRTPAGVLVTGPTLADAVAHRVAGYEVGFVDTLLRAAGGAVNAIVPGLLNQGAPAQQAQATRMAAQQPAQLMRQQPAMARAASAVSADVPGSTPEDILRIAASMARIVNLEGKRVARQQQAAKGARR